jgi:WD40 repeat protein
MIPLGFSPDSSKIMSIGFDRVIQLWDVKSRNKISNLNYNDSERTAIVTSKDFKYLTVGRRDGDVEIISTETGKTLNRFFAHYEPVSWLAISDDNKYLATATANELKLCEFNNFKLLFEKSGFSGPLAFSPDCKEISGTDTNYNVKLWQLPSGKELFTYSGHKWTIWASAFTPNRNYLITAGMDGTARVWNTLNGSLVAVLSGHKEFITSVAISPDSKTLVTGSTDDSVKYWSLEHFQELMTLNDFNDDVGTLLFSPDGTTLAVGCFTGGGSRQNVRIWQAPSLKQIDEIENSLR